MQQIPAGDGQQLAQVEEGQLEELRMQILMRPAPRPARLAGPQHLPVAPAQSGLLSNVAAELPAEKVDEEYLAMSKLLEENPDAFFDRVREVARTAGVRAIAKLPSLTDNPPIPAVEEARSSIPIVSGHASYPLVERFGFRAGWQPSIPGRHPIRLRECTRHAATALLRQEPRKADAQALGQIFGAVHIH